MNESQWREQLTNEGYVHLTVCTNPPDMDFGQHTHDSQTIHVILSGELILDDDQGTTHLKQGDRFEIPAGTTHRARCGTEGCCMLVGDR